MAITTREQLEAIGRQGGELTAMARRVANRKMAHRFREYKGKSKAWLQKEWKRLEEERAGVGYGPKPTNWVPRSVSSPEIIERQVAIKTELGQQFWQRPWSQVKGRLPERAHRKMVEKALREGEDVPEAVFAEYPDIQTRRAAEVGTDVATVWAISPEQLYHLFGEDTDYLDLSWEEWVTRWEEIEQALREHGGAVFHTGADGLYDVLVPGAVSEAGFLPPYNTPKSGGNSVGMTLQNRVASLMPNQLAAILRYNEPDRIENTPEGSFRVFNISADHTVRARLATKHQARVVKATMKQAGWWQIKPKGTGGIWWDSKDEDLPESAERYNGDGPADMMGDFLDKLDVVYRQSWGRPAYPEELKGVFDFVFGPVGNKSPEEHQQARGYQSWPLNAWVDATTKATGYSSKAIASLPERQREDLAKYYREYQTEGFNKVMDEEGSVSSEDVIPPSSEKARQEWESHARGIVRHHLTDTLRQYDIDPEVGGASTVELGIYPTFEAELSMSKGRLTERLATRHQARVVKAQMKQAGWWAIDSEGRMVHPHRTEGHHLGDGPLDMRADFIDKINEVYRAAWGRSATPVELTALFKVPSWAKESSMPSPSATRVAFRHLSKTAHSKVARIELGRVYTSFQDLTDQEGVVVPAGTTAKLLGAEGNPACQVVTAAGVHHNFLTGFYESFVFNVDRFKNADLGTEPTTGDGQSVGLFIPLPEELATLYPSLDGEDESPSHVTLLYVGEVTPDREEDFIKIVGGILGTEPGPIRAWIDGVDKFSHPGHNREVFYTPIRFSRDLGTIRDRLTLELKNAGFEIKNSFPLAFSPHTTLAYVDGQDLVWEGELPTGNWEFSSIQAWGLPGAHEFPLGTYTQHTTTFLERQEQGLLQSWGDFVD